MEANFVDICWNWGLKLVTGPDIAAWELRLNDSVVQFLAGESSHNIEFCDLRFIPNFHFLLVNGNLKAAVNNQDDQIDSIPTEEGMTGSFNCHPC